MNSTFHGACLYSWHNHLRGQKLWNLFTTKCSSIHCVHYNMKTVIIYMYVNLWFLRKTSLTPPLFIVEVHVPVSSQRWYLCLRGINFCVFLRFFFRFWNCSDGVIFNISFIYCYHFVNLHYENRVTGEAKWICGVLKGDN